MTTKTKHRINRILLWALIIVMAIWMLFPFYWALNSSFKTEGQLAMTPATFIPRAPVTGDISFTLKNYESVFSNQAFLRAIVNSTIVAVSVTVLALAVGAFAGFALGKLRYRGKNSTLYIILAMTMFPQIAVLAGLFELVRFIGIFNTPWAMILSYTIFTLPFTVWVLTT
ncbi:MAG: carbohydrate ABC transporter permease, partial [Caldilineaceae bacterium]|nr:carbohydrate ABC transporter permease [Caldilineaceae bacterium]